MRYCNICLVVFIATFLVIGGQPSQTRGEEGEILICPMMRAKQMPQDLRVEAMRFTGPSGEGRRGSAGFVVQTKDLIKGGGARLAFDFQRDASGFFFQVIHPFEKGHIVVSVHSGVSIHRGGLWEDIGWGNPATSDKVELEEGAAKVLPLQVDTPHKIVSQLSASGQYQLSIGEKLICRHMIKEAKPLVLRIPMDTGFWLGSTWDKTPFAGENFKPTLEAGHAGLILGPMDGSGPKQHFKNITLSVATIDELISKHFEPLFNRIDDAREFDKLKKSKRTGGPGGGPFEVVPTKPSLLVGFDYTTSTFYGGHLTVKSIRPIFRSSEGESVGEWHGLPHGQASRIKAKDEYVVAGIIAKSGHRVDRVRVIFMRVEGGRLNPDDTYRSEWIGGLGGGGKTQYAGTGDPIVGIYGRKGHDLDAVGFIQVETD